MAKELGEKMKNWIVFCQQHNLFYYVPAIVLAIITVIAAFNDEADAWPLLILAGICILVPNLDRLQSIQVTASGVMANLQKATADAHTLTDEAKKLLDTLRQSTIDTTAVSLELVQRSGWVGGFEEDVKKLIRESAEKTLKETGVTDDEVDRIMYRTWYRYDFHTYATSILGTPLFRTLFARLPSMSKIRRMPRRLIITLPAYVRNGRRFATGGRVRRQRPTNWQPLSRRRAMTMRRDKGCCRRTVTTLST